MPIPDLNKIAFVDLETSGANPKRDRITEIGIVRITDGKKEKWSRLINPGCRISDYIQSLTGISNEMLDVAPYFEEIADELTAMLDGYLFVAHSARFDYSFLKHSYKRLGRTFQPKVICSVKLSRRLRQEQRSHSLDALISRYNLEVSERHRALGDADLIWQFWQKIFEQHSEQEITAAIEKQLKKPSLPPHLESSNIEALPHHPGVYRFYGPKDELLYVGKSNDIRNRVLNHFTSSSLDPKELQLVQQTYRVDYQKTAGELGALLLESKWVKQLQPIYNRRLRRKSQLCSWQIDIEGKGAKPPKLVWADGLQLGGEFEYFGLFGSKKQAQTTLIRIAEEQQLCNKVLGIEAKKGPGPCFSYQLHRCKGACVGDEPLETHNARLLSALAKHKIKTWQFEGAIGIEEITPDGAGKDTHIVDNWIYLGTAHSEDEIEYILKGATQIQFDKDTYQLLVKHLQSRPEVIQIKKNNG